jgi:hypothetical protein
MNTHETRHRTSPALVATPPATPTPDFTAVTEWAHQATAAWAEQQKTAAAALSKTALESAEALHRAQAELAEQTSQRHAQAREKLGQTTDPSALLQAQTELASADAQAAAHYMQRCTDLCSTAQVTALACANDSMVAWMAQWPELMTPPSAGTASANPASALAWWAQAWQAMLPPPVFANGEHIAPEAAMH